MNDIYHLIASIYMIGWGVTAGIIYALQDRTESYKKVYYSFLLATLWPYTWYRGIIGLLS